MCPGYRGTFQPKRESKKRGGTPGDGAASIKLLILPEFTSHQTDEPTLEPQYPGRKRKKKTTKQKKKTSKTSKLVDGNLLNGCMTVGQLRFTVVPNKRP